MSSVNTALYVGIVNGQQLELRFRIQKPSARTHVNQQVESSGGVPGDWIELYNTANVPLSLAGYIVKDNDDTHTYVLLPAPRFPPVVSMSSKKRISDSGWEPPMPRASTRPTVRSSSIPIRGRHMQ
jgi:hypothetical protein